MTGFKRTMTIFTAVAAVASVGLLTGAGCPMPTEPLAVSVTAAPTSGVGTTAVTLTAAATGGTGTYTYAWTASPAVAITGASSASASASVSATTTFTCTVSDGTSTATASATVTITAPPVPTVTATANPSSTTVGTTVTLTASASGGTPPYTYQWIQTAGPGVTVNGATGATASASFTQTGTYAFQVTVTDHALATASASASVTVTANPSAPITVSAGADRSTAIAWPGASASLTFGGAGVPLLAATAFDPSLQPGQSLSYLWTVVSTPDATKQPASTISILQPADAGNGTTTVDVLINAPGTGSSLTQLKRDGTTTTVSNVVAPGPYVFQVAVSDPNGNSASAQTTRTITPAWVPQAAVAGSFAGLAAQSGMYYHPIKPTTTLTANFASLARVAGAIDFSYVDVDDATKTGNLASVAVTPSDTVGTAATTFSNSTVGTYQINAALAAGEVSVAAGDTGARVLVGKDWAKTDGTTNTVAAADIGQPNSTTAVKYAGTVNDAVGAAELQAKKIIFANIKGTSGGSHMIVMKAASVDIYKPLNNQKGNANTIGFASANFTLLESIAVAATDIAVGPLRGNAAAPELVIARTAGANPVVDIYANNGATGNNDKVYSVQADQTTAATPSTITFDYTGSVGATAILLANFSSSSYVDLILADRASVNGGATADGCVVILKGGTAGAIPSAGFSVSTGAAFGNLPVSTWKQFTGVAGGADHFGHAIAFGNGNVYVGAPDTATGTIYKIPTSTSLDGTAVAAGTLQGWNGPGTGFGSAVAVTEAGQIVTVDTTGGGTLYIFDATTASAAGGLAIPGGTPSIAPGALDARIAVGSFEGTPMVLAQDNAGNQIWLIQTSGTLASPLVPVVKVTGVALTDATSALLFADMNGDGLTDVVVSDDAADSVNALWGRQ